MSLALASRRGAVLNCRLAVNGIQNASMSSVPAPGTGGDRRGRRGGVGVLVHSGSPSTGPLRDEGGKRASLEGSARTSGRALAFASENERFALRQATVLRCRKISHGGRSSCRIAECSDASHCRKLRFSISQHSLARRHCSSIRPYADPTSPHPFHHPPENLDAKPDPRATGRRPRTGLVHQSALEGRQAQLLRRRRRAPARLGPDRAHARPARRRKALEPGQHRALRQHPRRPHRQPGDAAGQGRAEGDLPLGLAGRGRRQHRRRDVPGPVALPGELGAARSSSASTTPSPAPTRSSGRKARTTSTTSRRSSPTPRPASAACSTPSS